MTVIYLILPNRLKHWRRLYLQCRSSTPQKCLRSPGSCAPGLPSGTTVFAATECVLIWRHASSIRVCGLPWCSKCGRTYQRSRWPGACRRGWRPRCTRAPGAWSACEYKHLAPHPTVAPSSQMRRCQRVTSWTFVNKNVEREADKAKSFEYHPGTAAVNSCGIWTPHLHTHSHLGQRWQLWGPWTCLTRTFPLNARLIQVLHFHTCTHICRWLRAHFWAVNQTRVVSEWEWKTRAFPPGKHYVGVGAACAGARWAPLDSVDLFTVSLEVMDAGLLLHAPDLHVKAPVKHAEAQSTIGDCCHSEDWASPSMSCRRSRKPAACLTDPT